jgi:WD40 repeat protein
MVRAESALNTLWKAPGEVRGWDAATGRPFSLRLKGGTDQVCRGALSPDGKLLAAGCRDKTVRVWNIETNELIATLQGHTADLVFDVAFSPDGKLLASRAQPFYDPQAFWQGPSEIRIWDLDSRKAIVSIDKLPHWTSPPVFSPDGKCLAAGAFPKTLKVWDTASGRELLVKDLESLVGAVAFSPSGKRLAVATWSKDVRILDADTGELVKTCPGDVSPRRILTFSPDGKRLAAAGLEGLISLWDAESGQLVRTFKGHIGGVFDIAFSPDATRLASASADGNVRVWDTTGDRDTIRIPMGKTQFPGILLSPDGRIALTGVAEETIQLWNAATGDRLGAPMVHKNSVVYGAFTSDGTRLATTDMDKKITIWDTTTRKAVFTFKLDGPALLNETALSPDGNRFACAFPAGVVKVWDVEKGREIRTLKGLKEKAYGLEFSPEGTRLAAGDADGAVKMWDLATGREICTADLKGIDFIGRLRFSPDGKRLAVAGISHRTGVILGEIRIVDTEGGREVSPPLKGLRSIGGGPRFSPDGKRLATGGMDATMKVWDIVTGQETLTLKGHTSIVTGLAFSPDGHRLISASADWTVRVWDATPLPE